MIDLARRILLGLSLVLVCLAAAGCTSMPEPKRALGDDAEARLEAMAKLLGEAKYLQFSGNDWTDHLGDDGHLAQEDGTFKVALARPDRLRVDAQLAENDVTLWYDQGQVTLFERNRKIVARAGTELSLDEYLDDLIERYDIAIPGQDFLYEDLVDTLTEWVDTGRTLGVVSLGEDPCHQLVFQQAQVDWELWIDAGGMPVPRRLLIDETTSKEKFGYLADYHGWSFDPIPDATFTPDLAAGTAEVSLRTVRQGPGGSTMKRYRTTLILVATALLMGPLDGLLIQDSHAAVVYRSRSRGYGSGYGYGYGPRSLRPYGLRPYRDFRKEREEKLEKLEKSKTAAMENEMWQREFAGMLPAGYGSVQLAHMSSETKELLKKKTEDRDRAMAEAQAAARDQAQAERAKAMAEAAAPPIEKAALDHIEAMSNFLAGQDRFEVFADELREEINQGQPVKVQTRQHMQVARPNQLRLRSQGLGMDSEVLV